MDLCIASLWTHL